MTLTPQQKLFKQQKTNLNTTISRLKGQFSFHNIHTWNDVYRIVGYSSEYVQKNFSNESLAVTFPELKQFCAKLEADLEIAINKQTIQSNDKTTTKENDNKNILVSNQSEIESNSSTQRYAEEIQEDTKEIKFKLPPSPNESQTLSLYYFQKDAAAKLLKGYGIIK